jgi:hypothetical protein
MYVIYNIRSIYEAISASMSRQVWVYHSKNNLLIYAGSQKDREGSRKILQQWLDTIEKPDEPRKTPAITQLFLQRSEKAFCKLFNNIINHQCKQCNSLKNVIPEIRLEDITDNQLEDIKFHTRDLITM